MTDSPDSPDPSLEYQGLFTEDKLLASNHSTDKVERENNKMNIEISNIEDK